MNAQASVNSSLGRLPCTFPAGRCVNVCMFVCTYMCMHVCKRVVGWRLRQEERRFGSGVEAVVKDLLGVPCGARASGYWCL